jgi:hypothetical protein
MDKKEYKEYADWYNAQFWKFENLEEYLDLLGLQGDERNELSKKMVSKKQMLLKQGYKMSVCNTWEDLQIYLRKQEEMEKREHEQKLLSIM